VILNVFGQYDYLVRTTLLVIPACYSAYLMLRAGLYAFPQVGLLAVGSYVAAILGVHTGTSLIVGVLASIAASTVVAVLLGILLWRLNGLVLAIATIAFDLIVSLIAPNLSITGGAFGIVSIPISTTDWEIVGVVLACLVLSWRLTRTSLGVSMDIMRIDPVLASHQGVDIQKVRLLLFATAGVLCGISGALTVHLTGYIEPTQFSFDTLTQILAAAIMGGMTSYWGPLLGAAVIFGAPEIFTGLDDYRYVFDGVLIIAVIAVSSGGLAELIARGWHWGRNKLRRTVPIPVPAGETAPAAASIPAGSAAEPVAAGAHPVATTSTGTTAADAPAGAATPAAPVLRIEGVSKRYGGVVALDDVSLKIGGAQIYGIIGPNGSGKTTLLNILSGAITATKGTVWLGQDDLSSLDGRSDRIARLGVARSFQGIRLLPRRTVLDNIMMGAQGTAHVGLIDAMLATPRARRADGELRERAYAIGKQLDLVSAMNLPAGSLPYGVQRRTEIARAMVAGPRLLLLDEPTAGMTPAETSEIFDLLVELCTQGITVVVVEHDIGTMTKYCRRLAVLNHGVLISEGPPQETVSNEQVIEAYIGRRAHH
jgi:ABC-type branched-subunit amino acid transport system ATPase component/ABC-type branched-subunit amino acid transport system permease subunit